MQYSQKHRRLYATLLREYEDTRLQLAEARLHIDRLRFGRNVDIQNHFVIRHGRERLRDRHCRSESSLANSLSSYCTPSRDVRMLFRDQAGFKDQCTQYSPSSCLAVGMDIVGDSSEMAPNAANNPSYTYSFSTPEVDDQSRSSTPNHKTDLRSASAGDNKHEEGGNNGCWGSITHQETQRNNQDPNSSYLKPCNDQNDDSYSKSYVLVTGSSLSIDSNCTLSSQKKDKNDPVDSLQHNIINSTGNLAANSSAITTISPGGVHSNASGKHHQVLTGEMSKGSHIDSPKPTMESPLMKGPKRFRDSINDQILGPHPTTTANILSPILEDGHLWLNEELSTFASSSDDDSSTKVYKLRRHIGKLVEHIRNQDRSIEYLHAELLNIQHEHYQLARCVNEILRRQDNETEKTALHNEVKKMAESVSALSNSLTELIAINESRKDALTGNGFQTAPGNNECDKNSSQNNPHQDGKLSTTTPDLPTSKKDDAAASMHTPYSSNEMQSYRNFETNSTNMMLPDSRPVPKNVHYWTRIPLPVPSQVHSISNHPITAGWGTDDPELSEFDQSYLGDGRSSFIDRDGFGNGHNRCLSDYNDCYSNPVDGDRLPDGDNPLINHSLRSNQRSSNRNVFSAAADAVITPPNNPQDHETMQNHTSNQGACIPSASYRTHGNGNKSALLQDPNCISLPNPIHQMQQGLSPSLHEAPGANNSFLSKINGTPNYRYNQPLSLANGLMEDIPHSFVVDSRKNPFTSSEDTTRVVPAISQTLMSTGTDPPGAHPITRNATCVNRPQGHNPTTSIVTGASGRDNGLQQYTPRTGSLKYPSQRHNFPQRAAGSTTLSTNTTDHLPESNDIDSFPARSSRIPRLVKATRTTPQGMNQSASKGREGLLYDDSNANNRYNHPNGDQLGTGWCRNNANPNENRSYIENGGNGRLQNKAQGGGSRPYHTRQENDSVSAAGMQKPCNQNFKGYHIENGRNGQLQYEASEDGLLRPHHHKARQNDRSIQKPRDRLNFNGGNGDQQDGKGGQGNPAGDRLSAKHDDRFSRQMETPNIGNRELQHGADEDDLEQRHLREPREPYTKQDYRSERHENNNGDQLQYGRDGQQQHRIRNPQNDRLTRSGPNDDFEKFQMGNKLLHEADGQQGHLIRDPVRYPHDNRMERPNFNTGNNTDHLQHQNDTNHEADEGVMQQHFLPRESSGPYTQQSNGMERPDCAMGNNTDHLQHQNDTNHEADEGAMQQHYLPRESSGPYTQQSNGMERPDCAMGNNTDQLQHQKHRSGLQQHHMRNPQENRSSRHIERPNNNYSMSNRGANSRDGLQHRYSITGQDDRYAQRPKGRNSSRDGQFVEGMSSHTNLIDNSGNCYNPGNNNHDNRYNDPGNNHHDNRYNDPRNNHHDNQYNNPENNHHDNQYNDPGNNHHDNRYNDPENNHHEGSLSKPFQDFIDPVTSLSDRHNHMVPPNNHHSNYNSPLYNDRGHGVSHPTRAAVNSKGNLLDNNNRALRNGNNLHDHVRRPLSDPRGTSCNPRGVVVESPSAELPLLGPSLDLRDQLMGPSSDPRGASMDPSSDPRGASMGPSSDPRGASMRASSDPRGASMNVNPSNRSEPSFNPRTGTSMDPKEPIIDRLSHHTKKPPVPSFNDDDTTLMGGTYEHHMNRNLPDSTIITETPFVQSMDHQRPSSFDRTPKGPLFIDGTSLHEGDPQGISHLDNRRASIDHRGASPLVEDHKGPHWSGGEQSYGHKMFLPDNSRVSFDQNPNIFDGEGHLIDDRGEHYVLNQGHSKNLLSSIIREPVLGEYDGPMLEEMRPSSDPMGPLYDHILDHKGASYDSKQPVLEHRGPSYDPSIHDQLRPLLQEREVPLWNQKDSRTRNTPGHTWDLPNETPVPPSSAGHKSAPLQNLWEETMYPNGNNLSSKKRPLSPVVSWSDNSNVAVPLTVRDDPYQEHRDNYLPHQLPLNDECFVEIGSCNEHMARKDCQESTSAKYGIDNRIKKPLDINALERSGKDGMGKKDSVRCGGGSNGGPYYGKILTMATRLKKRSERMTEMLTQETYYCTGEY